MLSGKRLAKTINSSRSPGIDNMQTQTKAELDTDTRNAPEAEAQTVSNLKRKPVRLGVVKPIAPTRAEALEKQLIKSGALPAAYQSSPIRRFRRSDAWLWTELAVGALAVAVIVPTAVMLWGDMDNRQQQRIAQAWTTVVNPAPGNSGKGPALEYLVSKDVSLTGIDLSTEATESATYLIGVDLSGANLVQADLSKADLEDADLSKTDLSYAFLENAFLVGANFSQANLERALLTQTNLLYANLSGANLVESDFSEATLAKADLSGATVTNANFSGADLSDANLDGVDLSSACGNEWTVLPDGLSMPSC